ncbi:UNVERIFIED_ORG: flagellar hook-length control protein FliK [Zoogloea ramigera]|uniref:Flagellar hook-length control protein FliK n=1 Tax=Duganella zoogloeoides TaxID=75659 RepID=A0ABZ0Y114_9BURK|nr:flagellar hook-length control protein FliK [Duganella zoogloeoides]WQH05714.1 flagellar hook-length control protein FliK [Duganella zoogloeoides]
MLPRIDASIRPVGPSDGAGTGAAVGDARQGQLALQKALQGLVGQNVPAVVQSKFSDGSALVKVAEQNVRMMLPTDVKVGAEVSLTVLSASPRPTFQFGTGTAGATVVYPDGGDAQPANLPSQAAPQAGLGRGAGLSGNVPPGVAGNAAATPPADTDAGPATTAGTAAAQGGRGAEAARPQSLAAALLGKAPLTASADLPGLDHTTPQSTLSPTARALATILPAGGQMAQLALIGKSALFGNAAPDTDKLAQKLNDTISKSGLFYESHVTEWVKGERPLADLMREPQMQHMQQLQRLAQQSGESLARLGPGGPDLTPAQMVNQQLHTQEQGRVQWNGEAWPGQQMQWEVKREQRDGSRQQQADDGQEQVWRSGVRFRLPMLGKVAATVTMVGDQVHVQLHTDTDDAAATLRAYAGQFEAAMAAAGGLLSSLAIAQQDTPGAADGH